MRLKTKDEMNKVLPKSMGHPPSVPKIEGRPNIWATKIEKAIISWYIVPTAPLKWIGDISVKYIGARPAFKPENIKLINKTCKRVQNPSKL